MAEQLPAGLQRCQGTAYPSCLCTEPTTQISQQPNPVEGKQLGALVLGGVLLSTDVFGFDLSIVCTLLGK